MIAIQVDPFALPVRIPHPSSETAGTIAVHYGEKDKTGLLHLVEVATQDERRAKTSALQQQLQVLTRQQLPALSEHQGHGFDWIMRRILHVSLQLHALRAVEDADMRPAA